MTSNEHESLRAWIKSGRPYTEQPVYTDKLLAEYDAAIGLLGELLNGVPGGRLMWRGIATPMCHMETTLPRAWVERVRAVLRSARPRKKPEPEDESWRWL